MFEMKMTVSVKVASQDNNTPVFVATVQKINGISSISGVGKHPLEAIKAAIDGLSKNDFEFEKNLDMEEICKGLQL